MIDLTLDNHLLVTIDKRLFEFDTACICQREITNLNGEPIVSTGNAPFLFEDGFRRIWLLTLNEIKRIQNVEIPFEHLIYPEEKNNFVRAIYWDQEKQILLVGCYNGGIQLYDSAGKPAWLKPLVTREVKDIIGIEKLSEGFYLVVTLGNALYLLDIKERKLRLINLKRKEYSMFQIRENAYSNSLQRLDAVSYTHLDVYKRQG